MIAACITRHSLKKKKKVEKKVIHPMIRPERESNLTPLDCRSSAQFIKLLDNFIIYLKS